jgi:hypothetical protein
MNHSARPPWLGAAILVGVFYVSVGIVSSALAGTSTSSGMRTFWRLSAFVVSAVVLAVHVGHERVRLREPAQRAAWHASVAVALGALFLAVAANLHDLRSAAGYRPRMLIALFAWPLLTAVPAFVVAWIGARISGGQEGTGLS